MKISEIPCYCTHVCKCCYKLLLSLQLCNSINGCDLNMGYYYPVWYLAVHVLLSMPDTRNVTCRLLKVHLHVFKHIDKQGCHTFSYSQNPAGWDTGRSWRYRHGPARFVYVLCLDKRVSFSLPNMFQKIYARTKNCQYIAFEISLLNDQMTQNDLEHYNVKGIPGIEGPKIFFHSKVSLFPDNCILCNCKISLYHWLLCKI